MQFEKARESGLSIDGLRDSLESCGLGNFSFAEVDNYHRNCFFVFSDGKPRFVAKFLDQGWDINLESIWRDQEVNEYASELIGIPKRKIFKIIEKTGPNPNVVIYDFLGFALREDSLQPGELVERAKDVLDILKKLHTSTVSPYFGSSLKETRRAEEKVSVGAAIKLFLLNDIERENLDPSGEAKQLIEEKWQPILDNEKVFSLTHGDVTLSNILIGESEVALIDWSYSRWSLPSYDLSYLLFWLLKAGEIELGERLFTEAKKVYAAEGFDIEKTCPFFLGQKTIEYGRFKGRDWVDLGKKIFKKDNFADAARLF